METFYLLDTHVLLWFLSGDERLSQKSQEIISDSSNRCFISVASLWEMAIKIKIGKLKLTFDFRKMAHFLTKNNIEILPISLEHTFETLELEDHHRDPFDRLIIAQAKFEGLTIITTDEIFSKYEKVKLI